MVKKVFNKSRGKFDYIIDNFNNVIVSEKIKTPIITIYYDTIDYPDVYVARIVELERSKIKVLGYISINVTLANIRGSIPAYMVNVGSHPSDDGNIVESWI